MAEPGLSGAPLAGRVALVTGGGRGIGAAVSTELALAGVLTPQDVARTARFLVGPESGYVNDQRVVVNGGTF